MPDIDWSKWVDQQVDLRASRQVEAILAQQERDRDRATRRNSSEMAERYGVSLHRVQEWTRNGVLKAERPSGGFGRWSYLTGLCDDAIDKLRRPDGTIKGSWRTGACKNK